MSDQQTTLLIEIPSDVAQQEVWDVEEKLKQIEGVTTELQEPKDLIAATILFLHFVASGMGPVATIGGGIKAIHDVAKIVYDFLHPMDQAPAHEKGRHKVVLTTKKGKKVSLYDLSLEEIEQVLREQ